MTLTMLVIAPPFAVGTAGVWVVERLVRGIELMRRAPAPPLSPVVRNAAHPLPRRRLLSTSSSTGHGAVA
jgi:hypothetical protein